MMMDKALKGALIASTVCAMFASGAVAQEKKAEPSDVKCAGINSCKGTGGCAGKANSCKGHNACKGQGWTATKTAQECTDKGGKVLAAK